MPPKKKAAAPAPLPLDGCIIALSGTFPTIAQPEIEEDLIKVLGATLGKTVTKSTTHLVTTDTDFAKITTKVKQAKNNDIPIVSLEWLEDCLKQSKKLDEGKYIFGSAPVASSASTTTNGKSKTQSTAAKKRAIASDGEDDEEDSKPAPQTKKKAVASTKDNNQSQTSQASSKMDLKKDLESKLKIQDAENNITKSKDLVVQLDEHCPNVHHRVYIDDNGLIYDASLNQTNATNNNNKFYRVQVCSHSKFISRMLTSAS